jgi:hypothetical protein
MRRGWWRWLVVAAGTALIVTLPFAVRLLPVRHSSISAADLLTRIRGSAGVQYSGYAESSGGLALPVTTNRFNSINDLFGGTTQLRVWWRAADDWRVDSINFAGERDLYRDPFGYWTWNYESNTAERTNGYVVPIVRLPRADDLLPPTLARRLLGQAGAAEVDRLPDARIAGRDAAGLRARILDPRSTIERVDVWALPANGLPVRVKVFARDDPRPVLETSLLDLSTSPPGPSVTAFELPGTAQGRSDEQADIVATVDQFGSSTPPPRLAGLARRFDDVGAVGVYGQGLTMLVALPLPPGLARTLAGQLAATPGSVSVGSGGSEVGALSIGVGPVNLLLSAEGFDDARWLLAGTVTAPTLVDAVAELPPAAGFR